MLMALDSNMLETQQALLACLGKDMGVSNNWESYFGVLIWRIPLFWVQNRCPKFGNSDMSKASYSDASRAKHAKPLGS